MLEEESRVPDGTDPATPPDQRKALGLAQAREAHGPGRLLALGAGGCACAAIGFLAGWLVFGRAPAGGAPGAIQAEPSADLAFGAGPLREPVWLPEAVEGLADASRGESRPTAHRQGAADGSASVRPGGSRAAAPPRAKTAPGVKFHSTFETGMDGWFVGRFAPEIIGELARTDKEDEVKVGKGALTLSYRLEPGKMPLAVRATTTINRLSLWVRTLRQPAAVVIAVGERDDSNYQTLVHIDPAEGWRRLELDLATFTLADNSVDENDALDFDEIRSVAVLDVAGFMGVEGENTLLLDDVVGEYRIEEAPRAAEAERF